jgi:AraC-like DNA-binding protein
LFNQVLPVRYIFRNELVKFEEELCYAPSFEDRIAITEKFLISQIHKRESHYGFNRINHCVLLMNNTKGCIPIEELASACCLGRKQFERAFSDNIGTTPKHFMRIIRFQHAVHEKSINPRISLTELAYKCGYYDQSHLIADFIAIAGLTPKQYFKDCDAYSDYFQ